MKYMQEKLRSQLLFYSLWSISVTLATFNAMAFLNLNFIGDPFLLSGLGWAILTEVCVIIPVVVFDRLWLEISLTFTGYILTAFIFVLPFLWRGDNEGYSVLGTALILFPLLFILLMHTLIGHFKLKRTFIVFFTLIVIVSVYHGFGLFRRIDDLPNKQETEVMSNIVEGRYRTVDEAISFCDSISNNSTLRNECFYRLAWSHESLKKDLCNHFTDDRSVAKEIWVRRCKDAI